MDEQIKKTIEAIDDSLIDGEKLFTFVDGGHCYTGISTDDLKALAQYVREQREAELRSIRRQGCPECGCGI